MSCMTAFSQISLASFTFVKLASENYEKKVMHVNPAAAVFSWAIALGDLWCQTAMVYLCI